MTRRIPPAPPPPSRPVTIHDVARRAGVSTATVSRAIGNPGQVTEETRSRVLAAIRATGFTPNATARNLRARSTKTVLVLLPGLGNSFWNVIINSLEDVLSEHGYGVIFGDTRNDPEREAHYERLVRSGQVDGLLLFTGRLPHPDFIQLDRTIPITLVSNEVPGCPDLPLIGIDNRAAAAEMTRYLIGRGHRRIAHLTGPHGHPEAAERIKGYRDALAGAGIAHDEALIWPGGFDPASGRRGAERFFALADRPTAVFAASDEGALGLIKALKDRGLSVPEDVSVAGFDGIEYSGIYDPALTTVLQPRSELGRLAGENLVKRMDRSAPPPPPARTHLACTLLIRDSVGDGPAAGRKGALRANRRAAT
ncbi:MAG: LacI family DNA-binding transcriptional regulator [Rhizobiales bacterium]|nr:LacI family DNA-binding transcriptional regulator [Hyphomicrobiales bacterium]